MQSFLKKSTWAIFLSVVESVTLLDNKHRIKRAPGVIVGFADLIVLGVGIYSVFEILLSDFALAEAPQGYQTLWSHLQHVACILIIVIV